MTNRVRVGETNVNCNRATKESISSNGPTKESCYATKHMSLWRYLYIELTRGYWLEFDKAKFTERRKRVYTFMIIPKELEKFIAFGFFQCVDGFLFIFTFLPLRLIKALFKLFVRGCFTSCCPSTGHVLDPAEICDVLKGVILVVCCVLMNYIDVSMMYHVIRGQTVIKLYIFFNMLDVADKLFTSFGQDILDSLFWTATERRSRRREHIGVLPHLVLAIIYVFMHTILVLFQANTLNVAFNSHNKALLTIMMSNNFVELKGSVFKKFEKNNLFQMSCSDVRERFHLIVLLTIVGIRNLTEFSWNTEHFWVLVPDIVLVLASELLVDWVKHAFITKFNEIPSEVYREYTVSLAYDMSSTRHATAFSDHLDTISRRMGFIPLPLAVLLVRIVAHSPKPGDMTLFSYLLALLLFLCLITFKILNSIVLLGKAHDYIEENKRKMTANMAANTSTSSRSNLNESVTEVRPTSKDDLELLPSKSSLLIPSESEHSMRRTQSLVELQSDNEIVPETIGSATPELESGVGFIPRQVSFGAGQLMFNSTVCLETLGLEDDFVQQQMRATTDGGNGCHSTSAVDSPSKERKIDTTLNQSVSSPVNVQPLSEVDRYTMCSNSIVN